MPGAASQPGSSEYETYIHAEWEMFIRDRSRARISLEATQGVEVKRVLDVGCGAGQELLPFVAAGSFGVGTDLADDVGRFGRREFAHEGLDERVAFARSTAEYLPFRSAAFDVVVSRLALPYAENPAAIAEMARVLRPGGMLLLKIHHAWFYVDEGWKGLRTGRILSAVHSARVLASGVVYHVTGRHIRNRLFTHETFQSRWLLKKELARRGLTVLREMPDSNRLTPSFLVQRRPQEEQKL
ncbi:MAG TPA: class I SAM-dependent methyltransferase [Bryobacteraceae bacterium]|nr:class I SAM-dependent methyltransferase [Bryobacteraceae bacterium]